MTSAKELAAALSVDPESVAICGEGGFDPWRPFLFVSRRYRRRWRLCHRAGAGAWEGVLMNPPINFCPATATPDRFSAFLVADVRCASAAGRRDNANTASDRQRRSAHRRSFASGGTTTRPQLTDNETTFAGATAVTRTAFATAAPATIYPRLAICAGSTGGAFTRARPADNDKLAAGNAGDQGADNKHYRVKRTRNVTPPGCIFSSQSAGSHAAGCAGTLAI